MFKSLPFFIAALLAAFFAAASAHAQTVRWEPGSGTLAFNQLSELSLIFDQCSPEETVTLPTVSGLTFTQPPSRSESTSLSVINGNASRTRTVTLVYRVRPTERLRITIPAFQVKTDKGPQPVRSASFDIGDATVGQSNLSLDSIARTRISTPSTSYWVGEVFPINYSLNIARRYFYQLGGEPEWTPAPLTAEPWGKPELNETVINDDARLNILYKTRAYAKAPGAITLNSVSQLANFTTGNSGFGLFSRASLEQFALTAPPSPLTVKPLPSPAPTGFSGAVGKFTLDSKVVPATVTVGEPITWTLTLDGTGNWPDIAGLPARSVSKDFRVVTPQAKRTNKADSLFDAMFSEDIVLIPAKPGTYTLSPVTFTIFNPATGTYENLSTQPVTITVAGTISASASEPLNFQRSALNIEPPATSAPAAPAALPRDPLSHAGTSTSPLPDRTLLICLLSSVLCPLSVWLILALRRARKTDPARILRLARIQIHDTLLRISSDPQELQSWQRDTAILFRLPQAVPTPTALPDPVWSALWAEADHTLYGNAPLPADWIARATAALTAKPVPAFNPFQLFLPRNLLPLLLVLSTILCVPSSADAAETGATAYSAADYTTAEKSWRTTLASAPTDWAARHNLALALIQQNDSGEAAGHALAAFVQQPQNDSVRRTLAYACKSAGISPLPVTQLSTLNAQLSALASPTRWQAALILSAWLGALALAVGIHAAYAKHPRKFLNGTLLAFSLILALAAGISLRTYGPLTDARAVIVVTASTLRSIPTDLDTQKTTPLALGVIAAADKTFLGWTRLRFPDGQTGWTRTETLVALWGGAPR